MFHKAKHKMNNITINSWLGDSQERLCVCMPAPINQLFTDESIAVQIIFLDMYTLN